MSPTNPIDPATAHGLSACWSCQGPVAAGEPFCPTCGAVQPPGQADHFTRLGLPRAFDVDLQALDRAYFARQRALHPDRMARHSARERAIAESQSVSLNDAYETLRDPMRRAGYMLAAAGRPVAGDGATIDDHALLSETMEAREALMEAATEVEVAALAARAAADRAACLADVAGAFAAGDLDAARRHATRLRYLVKLVEEAHRRRLSLAGKAA